MGVLWYLPAWLKVIEEVHLPPPGRSDLEDIGLVHYNTILEDQVVFISGAKIPV